MYLLLLFKFLFNVFLYINCIMADDVIITCVYIVVSKIIPVVAW